MSIGAKIITKVVAQESDKEADFSVFDSCRVGNMPLPVGRYLPPSFLNEAGSLTIHKKLFMAEEVSSLPAKANDAGQTERRTAKVVPMPTKEGSGRAKTG